MFEKEDTRQPHIPWTIFDDFRDDKNCRYGDVATWPRMRSRVVDKFFKENELPEPTVTGLCRAIDRSRFGDVLAYLAKKKIVVDTIPYPPLWLHTIPKTYYIRVAACEELQSSKYTRLYGGGASYRSLTEALSKAIGELLERHVLLTPFFDRKNNIMEKTCGDTDIPQALIFETPRFFTWQQKNISNGLTSDTLTENAFHEAIVHCVKGESVRSGKKVYIPLQHVQWGPQYAPGTFGADTYVISTKTTSGAGGGFTVVDATLSGLCELIERDGFLIYWLNRLSPRRIRIDQNDSEQFLPRFLEVYHELSDRGYRVYFLDTTTDIHVPSIACVVLAPLSDGRTSISVTGKCHPDPHRAIELALLEHTAFVNSPLREDSTCVLDPTYKPFADRNIGKKERVDMWRSGAMTDEITFFLSGKEISFAEWASTFPIVHTDPAVALARVLSEFERMEKECGPAYEVFRYQARHPILNDLAYHVVKVVVPALVPLYLRESGAFLDSVRLREVPKKLGYVAAPANAYNPIPHPFP